VRQARPGLYLAGELLVTHGVDTAFLGFCSQGPPRAAAGRHRGPGRPAAGGAVPGRVTGRAGTTPAAAHGVAFARPGDGHPGPHPTSEVSRVARTTGHALDAGALAEGRAAHLDQGARLRRRPVRRGP